MLLQRYEDGGGSKYRPRAVKRRFRRCGQFDKGGPARTASTRCHIPRLKSWAVSLFGPSIAPVWKPSPSAFRGTTRSAPPGCTSQGIHRNASRPGPRTLSRACFNVLIVSLFIGNLERFRFHGGRQLHRALDNQPPP